LIPRIDGGRVAAHELLVVTSGIANLIRENKTFRINSAIQTGAKLGMQLLDDAIFDLWRREIITVEDALAKANSQEELAKRVARARQGISDEGQEEEEAELQPT